MRLQVPVWEVSLVKSEDECETRHVWALTPLAGAGSRRVKLIVREKSSSPTLRTRLCLGGRSQVVGGSPAGDKSERSRDTVIQMDLLWLGT